MLLALSGLTGAHASPAEPALITAAALRFVPGDDALPLGPLIVEQGRRLLFVNADNLGVHSIYSVEYDEDGWPLFWTDQQNLGSAAEVEGVPDLLPRAYAFFCSNHPEMKGTLVVTDDDQGA